MKEYTFSESSIAIYEAIEVTAEIALSPMDYLRDIEFYLLVSPYKKGFHIEAYVNDGWIYICFERDDYKFPANYDGLNIIANMAEIWYDTEDIEIIREYVKDVNKK